MCGKRRFICTGRKTLFLLLCTAIKQKKQILLFRNICSKLITILISCSPHTFLSLVCRACRGGSPARIHTPLPRLKESPSLHRVDPDAYDRFIVAVELSDRTVLLRRSHKQLLNRQSIDSLPR